MHGRLELVDTSKTYDDRDARHPEQTIADIAAELIDALATARRLAGWLSRAAEHTSHLGVHD